ncbi:DUF423 domain-containing protein [uncultured Arcticibacterium sp.]|uniref:DUF423 domain-containing protein n=1 Tax=uncultured Arcticibacterium sp. TaxID=2173042 RepID=UPI0030FA731D
MNKTFLIFGAILGLLGVLVGAFGAHALKETLEKAGNMATFETAVKYQFYHALALVLTGILFKEFPSNYSNYAGYSFFMGTIIFSGALYLICFTGIKTFGAVAPIGGSLLILGWFFLIMSFLK